MSGTERSSFSIVIPTYQRRDVVVASVRALAEQEEPPPFEVVVVVDGSTDGSAHALRALELPFPLRVVEQTNRGRAAAVNRGAAEATGDVLLILDDDMVAHPRLLAEHARSHLEGAEAVFGHIPIHPDSPRTFLADWVGSWAEQRRETLEARAGELRVEDFLTGQMSLRREIFERLGGFDTRFTRDGTFGGEDLDLGRRIVGAGCTVRFNPDAISWQRYVVTPRGYLTQWRQGGQAAVVLARKHPDHLATILRRHEGRKSRYLWRWLRWPLRRLVLVLTDRGTTGPRTMRLFKHVRNLEYFAGMRAAGGRPEPRPVRVLCYHALAHLDGTPLARWALPPSEFRRQMKLLKRFCHPIDARELLSFLAGGGVPRRAVLVTFDDCFVDLLEEGAPILEELGIPALAFAVSGRVGGTNDWDPRPPLRLLDAVQLRAAEARGIAIGSHARTHRMLNRIPREELGEELAGSLAELGSLGVNAVPLLAYPHGEHDADVRSATRDGGYAGAFTVKPALVERGVDLFALPRIEILRGDEGLAFVWKLVAAGRWQGLERSLRRARRLPRAVAGRAKRAPVAVARRMSR